ncbi:MAG: copper-binding protein [Blastocatellia bacterium]
MSGSNKKAIGSNKKAIGKKAGRIGFAGKALALLAMAALAVSISTRAGDFHYSQQRQERRYELKGVVKSVDKEKRRATIKHEKVGDYMDAMTMPFLIKDEKALDTMRPGDQIKATLVVTDDGGQWLENVVITSKAGASDEDKSSLLMGSSGNGRQPPPSRFDGDATGLYTCSMHLNYRANKAGKCPRCGMDLISTEPGIEEEFDLEMKAFPKVPLPGQPVKLQFAVFNPRTGAKVKEFGLMHDKLFHLFLVSQDLSDFQHIHPRQLPDGGFEIETTLKQPGLYKVYTDFYPLEGAPQVLQTNLSTAGWNGEIVSGQARLTPDVTLTKLANGLEVTAANADKLGVELSALEAKTVGEMKVQLSPERTPIISGQDVSLKYQLTDAQTGQPVRDLIPYLGAWGHMLILSEDQTEVAHSHPEQQVDFEQKITEQRGGPELTFDARFPAPGNYRVWTQFLRGRRLYTVAFDLRVERLR